VNTRVPAAVRAIATAIQTNVPTATLIIGPGASDTHDDVIFVGVADAYGITALVPFDIECRTRI
jgi:hypothetical protein